MVVAVVVAGAMLCEAYGILEALPELTAHIDKAELLAESAGASQGALDVVRGLVMRGRMQLMMRGRVQLTAHIDRAGLLVESAGALPGEGGVYVLDRVVRVAGMWPSSTRMRW